MVKGKVDRISNTATPNNHNTINNQRGKTMKTNTNFVLLNGDINHTSKDRHNRAFKYSVYNKDDLEIKMLKAEIEKKNKEIEKFTDENKTLKEELEEKTVACADKTLECEIIDKMFNLFKEEHLKVLEENEKVKEENRKFKEENKRLNTKINQLVLTHENIIALKDETIKNYQNQPRVRRLKVNAVKDIINVLIKNNGYIDKDLLTELAIKHKVAFKTVVNLYLRKTHARAWTMLDSNKLWVIKQEIVNLI